MLQGIINDFFHSISRDKVQFECKWFIRLENLKIDTKVSVSGTTFKLQFILYSVNYVRNNIDDIIDFVLIEEKKLLDTKRDVGELQRKVSSLKKELKTEVRKSRITDRDVSDLLLDI